MAVPRTQITTVAQAIDYALASAQAAANGVCPSTATEYTNLAAQVQSGEFGLDVGLGVDETQLDKAAFLAALGQVDGRCRMSADYKPSASGGTSVNPSTGGAAPPNVEITPSTPNASPGNLLGAGSLGLWVVGGLVAAYALSSKFRNKVNSLFKSKGKSRSRRRSSRRRRRRR